MDTTKVIEEALMIRSKIKAEMDLLENPIDMELDPVPPFYGPDEIKLIIIGQDTTIKNGNLRRNIKKTLNLDRRGSLKNYITRICNSLGISLDNVYATNIIKYFYKDPPARTPNVLHNHQNQNLTLLRKEIQSFPKLPIITLGEPVLQLISNNPEDKVRDCWGYLKGVSKLPLSKCLNNKINRPFYPFPHQPSSGRKFYAETMNQYLNFVKME